MKIIPYYSHIMQPALYNPYNHFHMQKAYNFLLPIPYILLLPSILSYVTPILLTSNFMYVCF